MLYNGFMIGCMCGDLFGNLIENTAIYVVLDALKLKVAAGAVRGALGAQGLLLPVHG